MGALFSRCIICQDAEAYQNESCNEPNLNEKINSYRHLARKKTELEMKQVLQHHSYILKSEELKLE